ncbi:MAG TPA: lysylphosphatidylglycerol synthase transmembrane domain-containing protein [Vicinamibacteria bacterium]|nr:lysylphosphatidylglycerol synthase transmembrane domain-containing protein [Vicinamibacteria bacterium]
MPRKRLSSPTLQTLVVLFLTGLLLWLFLRGSDIDSIRLALASADVGLVILAVLATMMTYLIRALRWQVLLAPLGHAGLGNCFITTVIGFMVNFLVPSGRVGEVARPYLLARREELSASSALATVLLERLLDLVTVTTLVGAWLLVSDLPTRNGEAMSGLSAGGALGLLAALSMLSILFWSNRHPEASLGGARRLLSVFPESIRSPVLRFFATFVSGLAVLMDAGRLVKACAYSIALWLNICLGFWLGSRALSVEFEYFDTFPVIGFLTIGVAAPTPGGIGGYHYMCALALSLLFGTDASVARAVALVNHAIAFVPVTLLGIVFFTSGSGGGLSLHEVRTLKHSFENRRNDN